MRPTKVAEITNIDVDFHIHSKYFAFNLLDILNAIS